MKRLMVSSNKIVHRDRSSGWKHAKISGHNNELLVCELINRDLNVQSNILSQSRLSNLVFKVADYGGLNETDVPSVLGGKTKSKVDISIYFTNSSSKLGISVKKSPSGQVYLITVGRFIEGIEKQYKIIIPDIVKTGLKLFWGYDVDIPNIVKGLNNSYSSYELRKNRLTSESLFKYDSIAYDKLIEWFRDNIGIVTDFCFSRGLASNSEDIASLIWYKNLVDTECSFDLMLSIDKIIEFSIKNKDSIKYGNINGGTTIQLPFGFVQWHQGQMQFHHNFKKISML